MKAVFGSMNLGKQVFGSDAQEMVERYLASGNQEIDAAYVYNDGECERLLGECLSSVSPTRYSLATKANPRVTGRLDRESVINQLEESLRRLRVGYVDIFYLHFPDPETPIAETIQACAELHARGLFRELGVSNFPLSLLEELGSLCDQLGCPRPSVFEGVYNALSRKAEEGLFPALDRLGMRFYAYNPLAGGMLTGRYRTKEDVPEDGRFAVRPNYRNRYWKDSYFQALGLIGSACDAEGIPMAGASLRWLANHSMLSESREDAVIVGASRLSQLEQNLRALEAGPLPPSIVDAFESAWSLTSADAPEYYRINELPVGGVK